MTMHEKILHLAKAGASDQLADMLLSSFAECLKENISDHLLEASLTALESTRKGLRDSIAHLIAEECFEQVSDLLKIETFMFHAPPRGDYESFASALNARWHGEAA